MLDFVKEELVLSLYFVCKNKCSQVFSYGHIHGYHSSKIYFVLFFLLLYTNVTFMGI